MFFPKHSVVKTIWYRELYSGWTLKIIFQGLVGCASFFLKRREKTNFNAHICFNFMFRFFCVVAWSQKLYIYSMGKKSSKSSMNRKRFFTFYKKKFFCQTSLFSHITRRRRSIISFIVCLKPRFMHEYAIKSFFMHFVTLRALKLRKSEKISHISFNFWFLCCMSLKKDDMNQS